MIDFHSHILPEIDDGSRNEAESKKMIFEAKSVGFESIISTSHYAVDCFEIPEYKRQDLLHDLQSTKDSPNLYLGSEIFITINILDILSEHKASTINGTRYILFELPLRHSYPNLKTIINNLKGAEYKLVLAHPERYLEVQNNYDILKEYKDNGLLLQCNFGSIIGEFGFSAKRIIKRMLKDHLVDFMGSDAHRANSTYLKIPKALEKISKIVSDDYLYKITTSNAENVLNSQKIY